MKGIILLAMAIGLYSSSVAQDHQEAIHETTDEHESRNFLGLFAGTTIIVQSGFQLPTIGLEYVREITPRVGIGLVTELEIGSHIIQKNEDGDVVSEVNREGAFLLLPSIFINVYKGLIVTAGYGIEFEKNENLGLAKLILEYRLRMHNPDWYVLPGVSWDHTKLFDGLVYGVTFGYAF